MPSSYTENYSLSQWEKSDKIQMSDFNADNAKIDAAIKAEAEAREALAARVARLGNCRIELLTYTGTGTYGQENPVVVTFSAKPVAFIAVGADGIILCKYGDTSGTGLIHASPWSGTGASLCTVTQWSGNTVRYYGTFVETQLNRENTSTWIIAFYAQDAE